MADELARVYTDADGNVVEAGSADAAYQLTGRDADDALKRMADANTTTDAEHAADAEKAQQPTADKAVKPSENKGR